MKTALNLLLALCLTFTMASCGDDEPELPDNPEIEKPGEIAD